MARSDKQPQHSRISVWDFEGDEQADDRAWRAAPTLWQRLRAAVALLRSTGATAEQRSSAELSTEPAGSRGQSLREAHRLLRRQLQRHPALRAVLPHLCHIEQALAKQGTAALLKLPVQVLRRGLLQLGRLPWDEADEPATRALHTLRLRLIEAIEQRGQRAAPSGPNRLADDSFHGGDDSTLGSLGPASLPPAGVVVDSLDDSSFVPPPAPLGLGARRLHGLGGSRR